LLDPIGLVDSLSVRQNFLQTFTVLVQLRIEGQVRINGCHGTIPTSETGSDLMRIIVLVGGLLGAMFAYQVLTLPREPALRPGAIRAQDAESHLGDKVEIDGIVRVHEKDQATFLDLGGDYPNEALAVVIWPKDRSQFGDLAALDGKPIAVSGEVRRYESGFEIVAREKGQVQPL
jgi:hypothetical protein